MSDSIKISPKYGLNPTIPVCFWCGKEKNEVALLGKINKEDSKAPMKAVINYEPCDKCNEFFSKGIQVIGITKHPIIKGLFPIMIQDKQNAFFPTGTMFVATDTWIKDFLTTNEKEYMIDEVLKKRKLLLPDPIVSDIVKELKNEDLEEKEQGNENN